MAGKDQQGHEEGHDWRGDINTDKREGRDGKRISVADKETGKDEQGHERRKEADIGDWRGKI